MVVALLAVASIAGLAAAASAPDAGLASASPAISGGSQFAVDAGFSAAHLEAATGVVPGTSPEQITITFDPSSPAFFAPPAPSAPAMTAAEIAEAYGLSPSEYAAAEQYFTGYGLQVDHAWADRLSLSLTGTATEVDRAFSTTLLTGSFDGRAVTMPAAAPSLPVDLEDEISSVAGLSSGFEPLQLPTLPGIDGVAGPDQNPTDLVTPDIARYIYDVSGLYNLSSSPTYATGKGIVLLLWGAGYAPTDLETFFSQDYPAGFPAPTVNPYPVDGAPAPSANAVNDPSNGSRELTLDIEWSGSMAPGVTLDAVYAPAGPASDGYSPTTSTMIDAMNLAVDQSTLANVAAISMSFGSADGGNPSLQNGFESDFAVAAHEKITVFAATGDLGGFSQSGCQGTEQPEYPAASPQVVAVGGTSVSLQRSVLGAIEGFSESAWIGSGGGFSTVFSAPSWQEVGSAKAPITANGHRGMPDVAATADYNFLYFDGQNAAAGGTSFATPLWAGMVTEMDALHGVNFGFLDPELYALAANTSLVDPPFHDITSGSNCLGPAGPGWDTATGWGSPAGVNLYEHFVASFVNLTIVATPSLVAPGGGVTVRATIMNFTSGAPIAGVSVVLYLSSGGLGGPCDGTFGLVAPVSNASGGVMAEFTVPYCYLGASAVATATVTGGGYYGNVSTTVAVNLLGFDPALAPLMQYPDNVILYVVVMAVSISLGAVLGARRSPRMRPAPRPAMAPSPPTAPPPVAAAPPPTPALPPNPPAQ